jgi:hypothetical protein
MREFFNTCGDIVFMISLVVTFEDIVNQSANELEVSKSGNSDAGRKSSSCNTV